MNTEIGNNISPTSLESGNIKNRMLFSILFGIQYSLNTRTRDTPRTAFPNTPGRLKPNKETFLRTENKVDEYLAKANAGFNLKIAQLIVLDRENRSGFA